MKVKSYKEHKLFLSLKEVFMKKERALFVLALFVILTFSSVCLAAIPVEVTLGKETILTLKKPCKRASLANPDIAGMTIVSPSELVLNGKKSGITSLIVWDKEGGTTFFDVIVYKERIAELDRARADVIENKIKSIAPDTDIKVDTAGETLVLSGTAKNRQVLDKVEKIATLYATKGCQGTSRSSSLPRSTEETKAEAKESQTPTPGYMAVNVSQQAMQQAPTEGTAPLCVLNLVTIPEAQQVILEVKVAQIDKTKLKELGISWIIKGNSAEAIIADFVASPSGIIGGGARRILPGINGFDLTSNTPEIAVAHFPSGVAAFIRALQQKGLAKILAEPDLVVRTGEVGKFHVGQRIPIQTVTGTGSAASVGITYEEVGVRLDFAPEVLETGVIRLKIDPAEVSNIAQFLTFQGIIAPVIDTRTVNTSVDLKEGESLILAGLLSENMKKNIQKIPLFGDIPILGALFRSTRDELENLELAFFISPRLVKPITPGVKTSLPTDNHPTPEEEREFQWIPIPHSSSAPEGTRAPESSMKEPESKSGQPSSVTQ